MDTAYGSCKSIIIPMIVGAGASAVSISVGGVSISVGGGGGGGGGGLLLGGLLLLLLLHLIRHLGGLNVLLGHFPPGSLGLDHGSGLVGAKVVELRRLVTVEHPLLRQNVVGNVLLGLHQSKVVGQVLHSVLLIVALISNKGISISVDATKDGRVSAIGVGHPHLI